MPAWLAERMAKLGRLITEAIVLDQGRDAFMRKLAHPFWFQSFGAVMGMDWHSSGITTSVMGALKRGLRPIEDELGIYVCGGRGRHSRKTPDELRGIGNRVGLDGTALGRTSRLVAKVDSAAVQDGFDLYLHSFVVAADGQWAVVQQGMNGQRRQARRYHWLSSGLQSFIDDPHVGVAGETQGEIVNLSDRRAAGNRAASLRELSHGPDQVVAAIAEAQRASAPRPDPVPGVLPHLQLPAHHDVRKGDVVLRRLHGALAAAAERGPTDFETLLLTPGVGARTVESLALVAEVIHGAPCRFSDPARFSYAHGGKDGHPFPVPLKVFDRTIGTLKRAVVSAKLGNDERMKAIARLDQHARRLEAVASGATWDELMARERRRSYAYGGRTVMGPAKPLERPRKDPQQVLPGLDD